MNAEIEEELPEPPNLEVTLLPHQRQALWWLNRQEKNPIIKGGILADAMGTLMRVVCVVCRRWLTGHRGVVSLFPLTGVGKTIEMLSLILHTIDEQNAAKEQAQNKKRVQVIQHKLNRVSSLHLQRLVTCSFLMRFLFCFLCRAARWCCVRCRRCRSGIRRSATRARRARSGWRSSTAPIARASPPPAWPTMTSVHDTIRDTTVARALTDLPSPRLPSVLTTYGTMARGWSSEDDVRAFVRRRLGPLHQMTWYRISFLFLSINSVLFSSFLLHDWSDGGHLPVLRFRVVLDEGHIIRNESTQTAKAAYALQSKYRWIMSGTPIQNRSVSPRTFGFTVQQIVCGGVRVRWCVLSRAMVEIRRPN